MSPRFWETFGVDPNSKRHLSSEWQSLIHPDDLKLAVENFEKHCADPNHKYDQWVRYKHKKGHWATVRCRGLAIRDENGKPIRMLGAHTDVTEIVGAREREKLLSKLKKANEDLTVFAYAASHDLQSPLKSLVGLFDILREQIEPVNDDSVSQTLEYIKGRLRKLESLLASVLDFSKLEHENPKLEKFSLDQLIFDIESETSLRIARQNSLGNIVGNRELFFRVFLNLVNNSLKFKKDGPIDIKIDRQDDNENILLIFSDNGIGTSADQLEKIFNFFSKAHSSNSQSGHGLGLAIVRKIIELHDGKVWAESEVDQGMMTFISLPSKELKND